MLCLKYGSPEQKEQIILIILSTDVSLLCSLKFGPVLLKRLLKYSGKSEPLKLLNKYFENNFSTLVRKNVNLDGLSVFLNGQSKIRHYQILSANQNALQFDTFHMKDLLEYYQKSKSHISLSIIHFAVLLNYQ